MYTRNVLPFLRIALLIPAILSLFRVAGCLDVEKDEDDETFRQHISNLVESSSLKTPFNSHLADGTRFISGWKTTGESIVKQSFIRLTPDRPFSTGNLWTQKPIDINEFSFEWRFRISTQNEKGGGEYLCLWISDQSSPPPVAGELFGMDVSITGIGFALDLKRDAGDSRHRDVRILYNHRNRKLEDFLDVAGCNMNVKYWEGRDDFSVLKSSRMRAKFSNNKLMVDMDARNTGRWRRCVTINDMDLPRDWLANIFIGMSGLNIDDSSNKDILEFRFYKDAESAWVMEKYEGEDDDPNAEWSLLVHHMEHEMFTVQSTLKSAIYALENSEASSERRITALEERLSGDITRRLDERLRNIENQVHRSLSRSVHNRVAEAENKMTQKIESTLSSGTSLIGDAWKTPFYILCSVIAGMCLLSYFKYKELRKQHLL